MVFRERVEESGNRGIDNLVKKFFYKRSKICGDKWKELRSLLF